MQDVAKWTVKVLQNTVPPAIPGINFLSGGMSEEDATVALNEINKLDGAKPWTLSFSYGRALQKTVIDVWAGKDANVAEAQKALFLRAAANSAAQLGTYDGSAAGIKGAMDSTYVKNYSY